MINRANCMPLGLDIIVSLFQLLDVIVSSENNLSCGIEKSLEKLSKLGPVPYMKCGCRVSQKSTSINFQSC